MKAKKIFAGLLSVIMCCVDIVFACGRNAKKEFYKPNFKHTEVSRLKSHWRIPTESEKKLKRRISRNVAHLKRYPRYCQSLIHSNITSENSAQSDNTKDTNTLVNKRFCKIIPSSVYPNCPEVNRKLPLPLSLIKKFPPNPNFPNSKILGCEFELKIEHINSIGRSAGTLIRDDDVCPFAICAISNQIQYCPELLDALLNDSEEILKLDPKLPKLVYITSNNTIDLLKKYGVKISGNDKFPN